MDLIPRERLFWPQATNEVLTDNLYAGGGGKSYTLRPTQRGDGRLPAVDRIEWKLVPGGPKLNVEEHEVKITLQNRHGVEQTFTLYRGKSRGHEVRTGAFTPPSPESNRWGLVQAEALCHSGFSCHIDDVYISLYAEQRADTPVVQPQPPSGGGSEPAPPGGSDGTESPPLEEPLPNYVVPIAIVGVGALAAGFILLRKR